MLHARSGHVFKNKGKNRFGKDAGGRGGRKALELIKETSFDVAMVDIRLPGIDGDFLIKETHRIQPGIRFVIHTGSPHFSLSRELNDLGIGEEHLFLKAITHMSPISSAMRDLMEKKES